MAFKSFVFNDLIEQFAGDAEILKEVVEDFIKSLPELVKSVEEAAKGQDAKALEVSAHTLKGASSNFLAKDVVAIAAELEKMGRDNDLDHALELLGPLKENISILESDLKNL